jgi:CheY-like chemotaxis protein/anti-sigma regulatory factor (Ser/Thr protein kinase)
MAAVPLGTLIEETIAALEPQAEARQITLTATLPTVPCIVSADRSRIKQILINLVGNAIKFTERGGVTVRLVTDESSGAPLRIEVADTGMGIPAHRLGAVFEAFQQADNSTARQFGGTGLGLTITRSLAQQMGFTIEVASEVGVGSTFSVVLTEVAAPVAHTLEHLPTRNAMGARTEFIALVIDDEADAREILARSFEELGCTVVTAASADDGIALARTLLPDIITLDIMMPRKNGWDALRELKSDLSLRDIPVIVVSVVAEENRGRLLGAVDYLDKPVSRDALAEVVRRNVAERRRPRLLLIQDVGSSATQYRELAHAQGADLERVTGLRAACEVLNGPSHIDLAILDATDERTDVSRWVSTLREVTEALHVPFVLVGDTYLNSEESSVASDGAPLVARRAALADDLRTIIRGHRTFQPRMPALIESA